MARRIRHAALTLAPNASGQYEILQLTLQEEAYCQLRAQGETRRTAWKRAFGTENVNDATLDTRVSRLEKRPDLLVYDDTVTYESVSTPDMIERTTAAWSMSLNLGTVGQTHHWYIGTRYSVCDTYAYMLKTGTIRERRHICHDDEGRPVLLPQAEYDKKKREMTSKDWTSQMLQVPVGDGELMFERAWFKQWLLQVFSGRSVCFLITTEAHGKNNGIGSGLGKEPKDISNHVPTPPHCGRFEHFSDAHESVVSPRRSCNLSEKFKSTALGFVKRGSRNSTHRTTRDPLRYPA